MVEVNVIDDVWGRIKLDKDIIESKAFKTIEVASFDLPDFWIQFEAAVQALSNEVTKIGFLCGKEPFPANCEVTSLLSDMLQYYSIMRDLYLVVSPEEVGTVVYDAITEAVLGIMSALIDIVRSLTDLSEKGAKERLTLTGTFWDACNAVKSLPRDNLEATVKVIDGEISLAADAQEELTTTIEEDRANMSEVAGIDSSDTWTNPERDLAIKAVGLVKVTYVCLQRLLKAVKDYGSCSSPEHRIELDYISNKARKISPALDNFVSELYHPIDFPTALENAGILTEELHNLLSIVKGFHFEDGICEEVVKSLLHFISHNYSKLNPEATNPVPELNNLTFKTTD